MNTLDRNHAEFAALVGTARRQLNRGRLETAAAWAQIAARQAWMNPTGRFADPELERVLAELAARCAPARRAPEPAPDPRTVLHIVTQAYQTGGSTRAVACWLEQDTGRRHRICLTRQGSAPPPQYVVERLRDASDLVRLDTRRGGLVDRAVALRAIAAGCDAVVSHAHPYDVVPAIAFAGGDGPPVIYVNHADHVFWVGAGAIDVLSNMRASGHELAVARRGVEPRRSVVMPRPLMPHGRSMPREEAKRRLGLRPEQVVVATAADASKYRAIGDDRFLDLVLPALERHPGALLLAAGPAPDGEWAEAERRAGGRIRALGRLPDITLLHEAADVYVDSFPFSSLTSLLEAGSYGNPVLTYRGHPDECAVLGSDTPGVDEHMLRAGDAAAFDAALSRAIADAGWRRDLGERTQRAIRDTHTGSGWRAAMAAVYAHAAALDGPPQLGPADQRTGPVDVLVHGVMVQTGYSQGAPEAIRDNLALLPLRDRVAALARLARTGTRPPVRHVLPEWLLPRLGTWRRRARAIRQGTA